jgi:hypothetical protein
MIKRLVILTAVTFATPSAAQAADGVVLWQSIEEGDAPQEVADKLAAMPEIKRAKVKGKPNAPELSIRYEDDGIEILGETFKVVPQFEGSSLSYIGLGTDHSCTVDIDDRYERFVAALQSKYPTFLNGPFPVSDIRSVMYDALPDRPSSSTTAMTDGNTVVLFQQNFTRRDPPSTTYSSSKALNAISGLVASEYRSYYDACSENGRYRVRLMAIYMSKAGYDAAMATAQQDVDAELSDASDKL